MSRRPVFLSAVTSAAVLLTAVSAIAQTRPTPVVVPDTTILAPSGAAGDAFGRRVAASGNRVIVGANAVDRGGVADVGAAYIYRREGTAWTHEATLQPDATTVPLFFGWSVDIDGDTAVVGSLGDNAGGFVNRGAAYVFVRSGTTWTQQVKLIMPDGQAGDEAGVSVAIHRDTVAVGAPYHDSNGPDAGAVWVFLRTGSTWAVQAKLVSPPMNPPVPNFGRSVAIDEDTLAVGSAPNGLQPQPNSNRSAAHVFVRQAGAWTLQTELVRTDTLSKCGSFSSQYASHFGAAVAVSGSTVVVGAPYHCLNYFNQAPPPPGGGTAYVFVRAGNAWTQQGQLLSRTGHPFEEAGQAVAIEGDLIVVGVPAYGGAFQIPGRNTGAVRMYTRFTNVWSELVSVHTADRALGDDLGASVAIAGGNIFASVPADDVASNGDQGSVRAWDVAQFFDLDQDGISDPWEVRYGLDATSAADVNGASGDPDGDGRTNLQEYQADTHPRNVPALTRYLAEGASTAFFDTRIVVANPGPSTATVLLRFLKSDGTVTTHFLQLPGQRRQSILVDTLASMVNAEFSTVVETDQPVVVDRTMWWDSTAYGTHAETAIDAPATTWYLAEGATHSGFNLFYLVQNATATAANLQVTYLLPTGAPIVKSYSVAPNSRFNIWVNREGAALASTDVSAVLATTNSVPVIVERAMYLDAGGLAFGAGHESAGIRTPSTDWYLSEGATGAFFDLFVLIANPGAADAAVQARYLLPNGTTITKTYTVRAGSRFNIWVDLEDPALADTAVSTIIASTNGVPLIVERSMWWPGPQASSWQEAHNSAGATVTGTKWALAEGEIGGPANTQTYVLIANTSASAGSVRVTLLFENFDAPIERDFPVGGNSRFNVDVRAEFPAAVGKGFSVIVASLGTSPIPIVVERAMYSDARGVTWAAGTNALATRLQ